MEARWSHKFTHLYLQFDRNPKEEVMAAISSLVKSWATNDGWTVHICESHPVSQIFIYSIPLTNPALAPWTPQSLWKALQDSNEYWQGLTVETLCVLCAGKHSVNDHNSWAMCCAPLIKEIGHMCTHPRKCANYNLPHEAIDCCANSHNLNSKRTS